MRGRYYLVFLRIRPGEGVKRTVLLVSEDKLVLLVAFLQA